MNANEKKILFIALSSIVVLALVIFFWVGMNPTQMTTAQGQGRRNNQKTYTPDTDQCGSPASSCVEDSCESSYPLRTFQGKESCNEENCEDTCTEEDCNKKSDAEKERQYKNQDSSRQSSNTKYNGGGRGCNSGGRGCGN